jgi:pheromone shutdown protein TraB
VIEETYPLENLADESFEFDIRTQSLFERDRSGEYSFAHNSFMEYFVAEKILAELDRGTGESLGNIPVDRDVSYFAQRMLSANDFDNLIYMVGSKCSVAAKAWASHLIAMTLNQFKHKKQRIEKLKTALDILKQHPDALDNIWTIEEIVRTLGRLGYHNIIIQHLQYLRENHPMWLREYQNLMRYFGDSEVDLVEGLVRHIRSETYGQSNKVMEVFRLGEMMKLLREQTAIDTIKNALPDMQRVLLDETDEIGKEICNTAIASVLAL